MKLRAAGRDLIIAGKGPGGANDGAGQVYRGFGTSRPLARRRLVRIARVAAQPLRELRHLLGQLRDARVLLCDARVLLRDACVLGGQFRGSIVGVHPRT